MQDNNNTTTNDTQIKQDPVVGTEVKLVTQNITIRSNDRTTKDIGTWRRAHISAESVTTPNRARLYDVYEDVILDGHLTGIIGKRIDSVLNKRLLFKVGEKPVPEMEALIYSKPFRDIITLIMESKFWGISGIEFQPGKKLWFKKIPRKHIKPKWQIITLDEHATEGISYTNLSNVWIVGDPDDLGLLLKCGFYALLKKGTITDWAEYIEVFGSPIISMTYDAGDRQTELAIDDVLQKIGNSTKIKIPKQAGLDVKDGKASNGDGKLQDNFRNAMNAEMSIIVIGNTETTVSSKSSGFAQSKTHEKQQLEITKSDMFDVLDYLNSDHFINILAGYGYPVANGRFEYDREVDIAYMQAKIEIDKVAKEMGMPIGKKYMSETYAIDTPEAGDELTTSAAPPPENAPQPKDKSKTPPNLSDDSDSRPATIADIKAAFKDFFDQAR
jgi:hypothetical protein